MPVSTTSTDSHAGPQNRARQRGRRPRRGGAGRGRWRGGRRWGGLGLLLRGAADAGEDHLGLLARRDRRAGPLQRLVRRAVLVPAPRPAPLALQQLLGLVGRV